MSIKIISTGSALPEKALSNTELAELVDTNDEWIKSRTGISSRHVCTDETISDLAASAAAKALAKSGLKVEEIDLILCSTISGDYTTPSLSCIVGLRLGAKCPAIDLNAACAGFTYALDVAAAYIETKRAKNVLIVSAEMMSKHIDWTDRNTCVLFGDGAGAAIVTEGNALKYMHLVAEPNIPFLFLEGKTGNSPFYKHNVTEGYLKMDGQEVFKFAVTTIEREVKTAVESLGITKDDIDLYVLHQANMRILKTAQDRLKEPESKFPSNIHDTGNMSSATIPVLLDQLLEAGKIKKGDTLFMSAFGAGLTAGSCVMVWE
jgi:3-oxoacyl-[acyl-carrier-protein] synthase III